MVLQIGWAQLGGSSLGSPMQWWLAVFKDAVIRKFSWPGHPRWRAQLADSQR